MYSNPAVFAFVHQELAKLTQAIPPVAPCDTTARAEVMHSYGDALIGIMEAGNVDFNQKRNLVPFVSTCHLLAEHRADKIIGSVEDNKCGILSPYLPSDLYESVIERLDPNVKADSNNFGGLSKKVLAEYDATVKTWPQPQEAQIHGRNLQPSHEVQLRNKQPARSRVRYSTHAELALGHHGRIGYRQASLMGVETEGPARDGGLLLRTSH